MQRLTGKASLAKKLTGLYPSRMFSRFLPDALLAPAAKLVQWAVSDPLVPVDSPTAYEYLIIKPLNWIAWLLWKVVDVLCIDTLLVMGTARAVGALGKVVRTVQNGEIQRYAAYMAVAAAVILFTVLGVGGL